MLWNSLQGKHLQEDMDKPAYVQIILDHFGMGQPWETSDVLGWSWEWSCIVWEMIIIGVWENNNSNDRQIDDNYFPIIIEYNNSNNSNNIQWEYFNNIQWSLQ